jgi:hypothetical protein
MNNEDMEQKLKEKEFVAKKLKEQGKDSAHNSDEDEDMKDARDKKEEKEGEGVINYQFLGSEELPTDPSMDEIEYSMIYRIPRIECLDKCVDLRVIAFDN